MELSLLCLGVPSLDISSMIDIDLFSTNSLSVGSVTDLGSNQYKIGTTSFVEGVVLVGDHVNPGHRCPGHVLSIHEDGMAVVIESLACTTISGDDLYVGSDITIVDSLTDNGGSISELTVVTLFSDAEIIESNEGLFKISVEFGGVSLGTSCLLYGASAQEIQQKIGFCCSTTTRIV
mmetsp:Transcript_4667/g.10566  ORF Transcript_4667/g.10566 Transcript_4667/m.10566 type:complete len:177 (+) Transcript_4667:476-1006(+)